MTRGPGALSGAAVDVDTRDGAPLPGVACHDDLGAGGVLLDELVHEGEMFGVGEGW